MLVNHQCNIYDALELSFIYGKNINILYNYDMNFHHAIKIFINFGTYTARTLLNHIWYLWELEIENNHWQQG